MMMALSGTFVGNMQHVYLHGHLKYFPAPILAEEVFDQLLGSRFLSTTRNVR
jgi:hypothetical protein